MKFRVLGPLEVEGGTDDLTPRAPKQRAVLALLVLRRNHTVQTASLVDELWGERPPDTALPTLRTYIYKLRKMIDVDHPGEGSRLLRSNGSNYLLEVPDDQSDLDPFEARTEQGKQALHAGDTERAHRLLTDALELWRGPALVNVPTGNLLMAEVAGLEERRLQALELRMDADLQLGHHHRLISELKPLITMHPLNEKFHARLMVALALSGRPHEALETYRRIQQNLHEELALDPGTELQALQRSILTARPLPVPRTRVAAGGPVPPCRHRPPSPGAPDTSDFVGRDQLVDNLADWLDPPRRAGPGGTVVSLVGGPGTGKTALALEVVRRLRDRFPDGQLHADLHGTGGTPADAREVLAGFLRDLGAVPHDPPSATVTRLFRDWCADRAVLMVLDDAASAWQVEALMPAGARCAVLVTSRSEYGAPGGRTVRVRELATPDAVRLLANLVGHRRVDAEREAAVDIVRLAGNLPLAVRAAAARLAAVPDWSLERFARLLSEPATRLRELRADDLDLQARYDACYERLDEREKWTFRLLALTGGRPFRPPDVAELLGCPPLVVEIVLARLVECHLLELVADPARGPARYAFSGLARCYAMERLAGVVVPGADALMAGGRAPG